VDRRESLLCSRSRGSSPRARRAPRRPGTWRARDAFERGSAAYRIGDYGRAATEYARADAIDPNPAALRAALDAATLADDPVLGTELVERSARAPADAAMTKAVAAARARFAHRTGRVAVHCPPGGACLATVDGAGFDTARSRIVATGPHTVVVQTESGQESRIVDVGPDAVVEIAPRAAQSTAPSPAASLAAAPAAPEAKRGGLPPAAFLVALGATAVAGGITLWSALDTKSRHDTFESTCGATPGSGCGSLQSSGQSAETRTNVLLAVSAALAVTTVTFIPLVAWRSPRGTSVALAASGAGASLRVVY
jgi:hypothetical protein